MNNDVVWHTTCANMVYVTVACASCSGQISSGNANANDTISQAVASIFTRAHDCQTTGKYSINNKEVDGSCTISSAYGASQSEIDAANAFDLEPPTSTIPSTVAIGIICKGKQGSLASICGSYPDIYYRTNATNVSNDIKVSNLKLQRCKKRAVNFTAPNYHVLVPTFRLCVGCGYSIDIKDYVLGNNCTNAFCARCDKWMCFACLTFVKNAGDHITCKCVTNSSVRDFLAARIIMQTIDTSNRRILYNAVMR